jgi:hypothetical protein
MGNEGIHYVGTRYDELARLLEHWGYEVVEDREFSQWQEAIRTSPLTGWVVVTGRRPDKDPTRLVFKIEEFWVEGDIGSEAVEVREGASLRQYHYHGQSEIGGVRWCHDPEGHVDNPCHVHPFAEPEGAESVPCDPIEPLKALRKFETAFYITRDGASEDE